MRISKYFYDRRFQNTLSKYQEKLKKRVEELNAKAKAGTLTDQELAFIQMKSATQGGVATSRRAQRRKAGVSVKKAYGYE